MFQNRQGKIFSFHHSVKTNPGNHPDLFSIGIDDYSPRVRWLGREAMWLSLFSVKNKNTWNPNPVYHIHKYTWRSEVIDYGLSLRLQKSQPTVFLNIFTDLEKPICSQQESCINYCLRLYCGVEVFQVLAFSLQHAIPSMLLVLFLSVTRKIPGKYIQRRRTDSLKIIKYLPYTITFRPFPCYRPLYLKRLKTNLFMYRFKILL